MPNWERITELRDFLQHMEERPERKFDMSCWIREPGGFRSPAWKQEGGPKPSDLRLNGMHCATAACLAGWTWILFAPDDETGRYHMESSREISCIESWAGDYLGLSDDESDHMFLGNWFAAPRKHITKEAAVVYLTHVIEAKNIFIRMKETLELIPHNQSHDRQ